MAASRSGSGLASDPGAAGTGAGGRHRATRRLPVLALVALVMVLVAACSPPSDLGGGSGAKTLQFAVWSYSLETIDANIKEFETANAGTDVQVADYPWNDYHDVMATKFTGGSPPDVEYSSDHWLQEWVSAGWIAPIEEHCPELGQYKNEWAPYATQGMTHDGKLYGLPYYADLVILIYNEKMLREAGFNQPPQTWDELTRQAVAIKEKGLAEYPINIPLKKDDPWSIEIFYSMVYSLGGHMFEGENPAFARPGGEAEKSLQWLVDARQKHKVMDPASLEVSEPDVVKTMGAGKHAFTVLAKYNLADLNQGNHTEKGNFKTALMPGSSHETVGFVRFYALSSAAAKAGGDKLSQSCKLINYFGGKSDGEYKVVKRWALEKGLGFANLPLYDDPKVQEAINAWGSADLERQQAELARPKEGLTRFWGAWDISAREQISGAVSGQVSAQQALVNMEKRWAELR
jgi:multiple sugar transport system substrate-binding protein